jgi:hypothetical protein
LTYVPKAYITRLNRHDGGIDDAIEMHFDSITDRVLVEQVIANQIKSQQPVVTPYTFSYHFDTIIIGDFGSQAIVHNDPNNPNKLTFRFQDVKSPTRYPINRVLP